MFVGKTGACLVELLIVLRSKGRLLALPATYETRVLVNNESDKRSSLLRIVKKFYNKNFCVQATINSLFKAKYNYNVAFKKPVKCH